MGLNYELERHIAEARRRGNTTALDIFSQQQSMLNALKESGVIFELPVEPRGKKEALSDELARRINETFGQNLEDDTPFSSLCNVTLTDSQILERFNEEYPYPEWKKLFSGLETNIQGQVILTFTQTHNALHRIHLPAVVGTIRSIKERDIQRLRNIGPKRIEFLKTAFAAKTE